MQPFPYVRNGGESREWRGWQSKRKGGFANPPLQKTPYHLTYSIAS